MDFSWYLVLFIVKTSEINMREGFKNVWRFPLKGEVNFCICSAHPHTYFR